MLRDLLIDVLSRPCGPGRYVVARNEEDVDYVARLVAEEITGFGPGRDTDVYGLAGLVLSVDDPINGLARVLVLDEDGVRPYISAIDDWGDYDALVVRFGEYWRVPGHRLVARLVSRLVGFGDLVREPLRFSEAVYADTCVSLVEKRGGSAAEREYVRLKVFAVSAIAKRSEADRVARVLGNAMDVYVFDGGADDEYVDVVGHVFAVREGVLDALVRALATLRSLSLSILNPDN